MGPEPRSRVGRAITAFVKITHAYRVITCGDRRRTSASDVLRRRRGSAEGCVSVREHAQATPPQPSHAQRLHHATYFSGVLIRPTIDNPK